MTIKTLAVQREHNTESIAAHYLEPQRTWASKTLKNTLYIVLMRRSLVKLCDVPWRPYLRLPHHLVAIAENNTFGPRVDGFSLFQKLDFNH